MANYRLSQGKKKSIIVDMEKATEEELKIVALYIQGGYEVKPKAKSLTYDEMYKQLKKAAPDKLNDFETMKNDKTISFFAVKSWFNDIMKATK